MIMRGRHASGPAVGFWLLLMRFYQGPMQTETIHFLEAVALDRPVLVTPEQARQVIEVTLAADLSAERHQPVPLPLPA